MSDRSSNSVTADVLKLPIFDWLRDRRFILASSNPEVVNAVRQMGLNPEIISPLRTEYMASDNFKGKIKEKIKDYNPEHYPLRVSVNDAVHVFVKAQDDAGPPPDMVIGAYSVVLFPAILPDEAVLEPGEHQDSQIYERPVSKQEQLEWLTRFNGKEVSIVTGVTSAVPLADSPGHRQRSIVCATTIRFHKNPPEVLGAYVESGRGIDKSGGFEVNGPGAILVSTISGDHHNALGFPTGKFWRMMNNHAREGGFGP